MEFKEIKSQEELDQIIGERLNRQEEKIRKEYSDYDAVKQQKSDLEQQLAELQASTQNTSVSIEALEKEKNDLAGKVKVYELNALKTKYALECGIPFHLAERITGEDEESIKKDAQSLSEFFKMQHPKPPLKDIEPQGQSGDEAYKNILRGIKGE